MIGLTTTPGLLYPPRVTWQTIDSQSDLDALDGAVCWPDARVIEFQGGTGPRSHVPSDVSRGGYDHPDIHVLVRTDTGRFLEIGFIHCEALGRDPFSDLPMAGRVDSLKRVELRRGDGTVRLRTARLIYRWVPHAPVDGSYYWSRE